MARTATINASTARTRKAASQAKDQAEQTVSDLRSDMANLKKRFETLAAAGGADGMDAAKQLFERMHERFDAFLETDFAEQLGINAAIDKGHEKVEDLRGTVQENPLQSVLIAAGVGALVGFLMRR